MRDLSEVPDLGFWQRRKLKGQGWQLVYEETIDFIANQHDNRPASVIYPPLMQAAIAGYGGQDKVKVLTYTRASVSVGPGSTALRATFYVLGRPENRVSE